MRISPMAALVAVLGALGSIASAVALILVMIRWASELIAAYGPMPVGIGAGLAFVIFGLMAVIGNAAAYD